MFFEMCFEEWFWMIIVHDVSQNRRRQTSKQSFSKSFASNLLKHYSQAFFSNTCHQQSFWEIIVWCDSKKLILNDYHQWCLSEVFPRSVSNKCCQMFVTCSFLSIILKQSSQTVVHKSHSERLFFDAILIDGFWMSVTNNVSQNRRRQAF